MTMTLTASYFWSNFFQNPYYSFQWTYFRSYSPYLELHLFTQQTEHHLDFNLYGLASDENILEMVFQNTSPNTAPWAGLITSVFIIILSANVLGLFPYAFTATSHISLTYSLGFPIWMAVNILGFYLAFNSRLSHLVPQGTPSALIPLMVWIETLSLFAQPIALGLRLAANLTAGHLLIFLLSTAIWLLSSSLMVSIPIFIVFVLLFVLEIGVACIQAYVFTALVHFYLQQNI
uniref:ATP synthase subunit a n=1 Tax=Loxechinus albus TaxID=240836 RepID=A0A139YGY9_9ECHO|nr:ATP synthase F0 subunit 6 [Loxechinus albus]